MNYPMRDKAAHFRRPLGPDQNTANIPIIDISAPDADQKEVAKHLVDAAEEHGFIYIRNLGRGIQAKDIDGAFDLVSLGVDDFFSSAHNTEKGASSSILRFLRYPPPESTAHSEDDIRAGAHSDYGSITLLFRLKGQAGLEVLRKDNVWAPVPVCPDGTEEDPSPPILINIGDLLSYWTNGLFRSTLHRVVFPSEGSSGVQGETSNGPRYSIAYFCHPVGAAPLEPVPSERVKNYTPSEGMSSENPYATRKVMTADEHLFMRLKESYGDLYEEKS
ncbi:hypothetical protein LB503_002819 [Fusarium chuoi]|nr:hypothetical protein LB503_002819 [Fusarium chuoi]